MIILEQISKRFKRKPVLENVSLQIQPGEHIALVGSNGAGKTTLMRCLLGEYCCDGTISIGGLNPRRHRQKVLARVGFVPQLPPPLKMPVNQLIQFAGQMTPMDFDFGAVAELVEGSVDLALSTYDKIIKNKNLAR